MEDVKRGQGSVRENLLEEAGANTADSSGGEINKVLCVLFELGAVVELRAFRGATTESGYFDDWEALELAASELDRRGYQVYVTLNELDPALLARAANRTRRMGKGDHATSDRNIRLRRWLPLDFDPVRPAGVSSTDEEKRAALLRAREVRDYLSEQAWPVPVVGDSGNGYHLLYRIDLPNDPESLELVKGVLEALAFKFDDDAVKLDIGVHNAARIWKLYGTTARKGDNVPQRPHRVSRLLEIPEAI